MSAEPTEEQLRAYEEELKRLTSTEIAIQAAATLISIGGHRLGLGGGEQDRDLEQVRDAIDGAMALMPILERRLPPAQVSQLRTALSQLQMSYATQVQSAPAPEAAPPPTPPAPAADASKEHSEPDKEQGRGPAESSGRLWVPGR